MLREFRVGDLPRLVELQREGFPEENELYGIRPEELEPIVRRLQKLQFRFLLGFLRAIGRPVFRFPVIEADGQVVATTVLSFAARSGYLSMVMVDPAQRRHGFARRLVERSRELTRRRGKPYVVLDVLEQNTPARNLYSALGYRTLRSGSILAREAPFGGAATDAAAPHVRPFERRDVPRLLEIAAASTPRDVAEVLPLRRESLLGGGWSSAMFAEDAASWVVDRGSGPEAFVGASSTRVTRAAHLIPPIVRPDLDPAEADGLLRTALGWVAKHEAPRVVVHLPEENTAGRQLLIRGGFHDAIPILTLYRAVA